MCGSFRCSSCYAHKVSGNCHGFGSGEQWRTRHAIPLLSSRTSDECCCLHWGLEAVVKPWIDSVRGERPYVFQQDSAPSHKAMTTQDWMSENLHDYITPNMWPSSSPDLNPLDYYVWGIVERETNKHSHNTLDFLRAAITRVMTHINEDHLIRACKRFR